MRLCLHLSFIFKIIVLILVIILPILLKIHTQNCTFILYVPPTSPSSDLLILTILGAEYKLWSSSLCFFIHYSDIFSFVTLHLNPGLTKKLQGTLWSWYRLPVNMSCQSNVNRWWRNQHRARFPEHFSFLTVSNLLVCQLLLS